MKIERCYVREEMQKDSDPPLAVITKGEDRILIGDEESAFIADQLGYIKLKRISRKYKKETFMHTMIEFDLGEGCKNAEISNDDLYL